MRDPERGLWRRARISGAVVVLLVYCIHPAFPTVVLNKTLGQLSAEADMIFVGTVADVQPQWVDASQQHIETLVTFSDLESLWGVSGGDVVLRFSGGQMGDVAQRVEGVPRFSVGERLVIFARAGRLVSPIVGFHQGCFQVHQGPDGPTVTSPSKNRNAAALAVAPAAGTPGSAATATLPLSVFLDQIRAELNRRRAEPPE